MLLIGALSIAVLMSLLWVIIESMIRHWTHAPNPLRRPLYHSSRPLPFPQVLHQWYELETCSPGFAHDWQPFATPRQMESEVEVGRALESVRKLDGENEYRAVRVVVMKEVVS